LKGKELEGRPAGYAAVVQVRIEPDSDPSHRHEVLQAFVVPEIKAHPGYLRGQWMNDREGTGLCLVVFDTEANARAGLEVLVRPGGPEILGQRVYEIEVEA